MALREELSKQGDWLFRWRSYLPLFMLPLFALALIESTGPGYLFKQPLDRAISVFCVLVSFAGLLFRALVIGFAPRGTSGGNTKKQRANTLSTTGIYSTVRHPLYFGNFIIFLGIVMFVKVWWFALLAVLTYWLYYERIMYREEEFLRGKFGEEFIAWAEKTPAFIPRFNNWQNPKISFSLQKIIFREYIGFFEIIACFTIINTIKNYLLFSQFSLSRIWTAFFIAGCAVFCTVKIAKKIKKK